VTDLVTVVAVVKADTKRWHHWYDAVDCGSRSLGNGDVKRPATVISQQYI